MIASMYPLGILALMSLTNYTGVLSAFSCDGSHHPCSLFVPSMELWLGLIASNVISTMLTEIIGMTLAVWLVGDPGYRYVYSPWWTSLGRHFSAAGFAYGGMIVGASVILHMSGANG
ncbi:uncharacterized protein BJ171DRAFT_488068 [Polychytrium aggregatum]|uniref:uncharacterized protein n=1 Tax=Polychytrium aggregatum TaxID=110093 RepID=UPI0022FED39B|nr:uncharacterized protein BJ171DRAFT_488068 [Polychytrium aggregatum]KAI9208997.1 hypothetical protein BJ171DRAFT_488068 [Polychytrium aggregatum]